MSWYTIFYLFTIADNIRHSLDIFSNWFLFFSIISGVVYAILFGVYYDKTFDEDDKISISYWRGKMGKAFTICFLTTTILWIGWAACPSKKDMLLIVAGGAVGEFVTHDKNAKELPGDVTKFLRVEILKNTQDASGEVKKALGISSKRDSLMKMSKDSLVNILEKQ